MSSGRGRKWWGFLGCATLLLVMLGVSPRAQAESSDHHTFKPPKSLEAAYVPGEVLVKFKESPDTFRGKPSREHFPSVHGAAAAEFVAALPTKAQAALEKLQGRVVRAHPNIGVLRVKLPAQVSVSQAIESLYRSGAVEYAEPNGLLIPQGTPLDPQFTSQWGLQTIKAPEAWDIVYPGNVVPPGSNNAIVAVIDTGVDYNHEDLAGNMWVNTAEWSGAPADFVPNGIDEDGDLVADDYYGIDTSPGPNNPATGNPLDTYGHGTGMAGIIGAVGNNNKGIAGVSWQTKIMALKCMTGASPGTLDNAISCISYSISKKKKENASLILVLGWKQSANTFYSGLHSAITNAQENGVLIVAAAGNDGEDNDVIPNYPSSYNHDNLCFSPTSVSLDNIISVGGSDQSDKRVISPLGDSSYGMATVDLFAPGKDILTTNCGSPENKYGLGTGTSYAAAHVAGACALLWSRYPDKDWKQIKALILNGAEDGAAQDFRAICVTEGRLNLANSLNPAMENAPAVFSIFEVNPAAVTDPTVVPARADTGDTLVITGVNFGAGGTINFLDTTFPAANIVSWADEKIVATVPTGLPKGVGRLLVTNAAGLTSRGACFSNISRERQVGSLILARGLAAGAQVGRDVWIIGGRTYWGIVPQVEKYSLDTNHTVIESDWMMPTPVSNAGAVSIGTKIYVVGGATEDPVTTNAIPVSNLQIFDTATLTWEAGPPLPKALMQCAVTSIGSKLYAFGGLKSTGTNTYGVVTDAYVYDTVANAWSSLAVLPTAVAYAAAAPTGSGKIWVMGGFSSSGMTSQLRTVQEYNPATNLWTPQLHMVKTRGGAAGINFGGKVYSLRGSKAYLSNNYDEYADGEWYNPTRGYWMPSIMNYLGFYPTSPAPTALNRLGLYSPSPGKYLDKIYLLGGVLGTASNPYKFDYSNKVWAFPAPGGARNKGVPAMLLLLLDD